MGPQSFMQCTVRELVEWQMPESALMGAVHVVLALLHLSLQPLTLSLLDTVLPVLLATSGMTQVPDFLHARMLARLTVAAIVANHTCVQDSLGRSEKEEKGEEKEDKDKEEEEEEAEWKWKDPVSRALGKLLEWLGEVARFGEESPRMDFTGALLDQLSLCEPQYTQHIALLLPRDMLQQMQHLCDKSLSAAQVLALSDLSVVPGREAAARAVWLLHQKESKAGTRSATGTATVPAVSRSVSQTRSFLTEFGLNGVVTR